jgi:acyl carrier protein
VESGIAMSAEYVAPRNETEEMLAAMWQELIGLDRMGINENFFEIGGNSILALKLIHKINDFFQIEIPLRQLFDTPTVADFAAALEEALLAEIEALTDEEAERLLTNEK